MTRDDRLPRDPHPDPGRRAFLRTAGLAGAGAVAAGAVGADAAAAQGVFPPEDGETRYRLTPHVERFYQLNRL